MVLAKKIFWLKGVLKKNFLLITIFFSDLGVFWKICLGGFLHCFKKGFKATPKQYGINFTQIFVKKLLLQISINFNLSM